MMNYIFDIDGTITPARLSMTDEMVSTFIRFCLLNRVYLCTGSDWTKVLEQVPLNILKAVEGVFTCSGNAFYSKGVEEVKYRNEFEPDEILLEKLTTFIENSPFPIRTGSHFEFRTGMMNFSVVGRACSQEQRLNYAEWDRINKEREKIAAELRERFPLLDFNIGGEISIDIHPKGNDKSRAIELVRQFHPFDDIHFFGDRMMPGGNDYPVIKKLSGNDRWTQVENWKETRTHLEAILSRR
jgi:phosphomannomutase